MPIFGWDSSHYDGTITIDVARAARAEGIVFATAKIGEGGSYDDPLDAVNLAAFRAAGIDLLGGYYVMRTTDVAAQVANCIRLADRDEPWWRTFPGWFWQIDLERWPYDNVAASVGIDFGKQLRQQTGKVVVLYASRDQYGDSLSTWDGPLWNADYPSSRQAPFRDMYPGDNYKGWAPYSGKVPDILQYASTSTIGGVTTCDANAFRGTYDQLRALLTGRGAATMYCNFGDGKEPGPPSEVVKEMQLDLVDAGGDLTNYGGADGRFGPGTALVMVAVLGADVAGDGHAYQAAQRHALQKKLRGVASAGKGEKGDPGPAGPPGPQGPAGPAGLTPSKVRLELDGVVINAS